MLGISTRVPLPTAIQGVSRRYAPADNIRTNRRLSVSPMTPGHAIRNASSAIVPGVVREIEIWRVALLMVNRYAGDAEANSFRRAVELRPKCEFSALCAEASSGMRSRWAAIWRRVTVAIEQLTDTTGPPN